MSNDTDVHTYNAGSDEVKTRPRSARIVLRDGRERCDRPGCDGSCNASERVNEGAAGWLRRLRGGSE
jgi:hypothetical protein